MVAREVRQIESQPAKGPADYADTGRVQVQPAYAVALRVRPVPVARPCDLVAQVIGVQAWDSVGGVGTHLAPARIHSGEVDDRVIEVDKHRLWGTQGLTHPPSVA